MPTLTSAQVTNLRDALADAFDRQEFSELVGASVNLNFAKEIEPGKLTKEIRDSIEWTERRGITVRLLVEAKKARPHHQPLLAILDEVKASLIAETAAAFTPAETATGLQHQLERVIRPELAFENVVVWRECLEKAERAVCRVELTQGSGEGTGFLVAKNLVITCYHVIDKLLLPAPRKSEDVVLRFDYKRNSGQTPIRDREYRLQPDWLAASSPVKELDYALLRVAGDAGDENVGTPETPQSRGWLGLSSAIPPAGHPVQIVQHPCTLPMKLSFGTFIQSSAVDKIEYNANTDGGSSGSPVSTQDWKVVALHNAGGINNRGSSGGAILRDLESKQLSGLLG